MSILSSVQKLVAYAQATSTELANVKQQLADALANDAADDDAIAAAQLAASEAKANADRLQSLVTADELEDAEVEAAINAALPPVG